MIAPHFAVLSLQVRNGRGDDIDPASLDRATGLSGGHR